MANPEDTLTGEISGRYLISHEIGRGGTAYVYEARDVQTGDSVALKILRIELALSMISKRFLDEVKLTSQLTHPSIIRVLDSGVHEDRPYVVLPLMSGGTLRRKLRLRSQLPIEDAVTIARTVALALGYAHREGYIHRDVKPENILLEGGVAYLADFGIARAMERSLRDTTTSTNVVRGTVPYMSPEQATADKELDGRTDIYSLGCVFYEMLGGEPPFTGPNTQAIIARHLHEPPRSLRIVRPKVPAALQLVVERALAKNAADRYQAAEEFAEAMQNPPPVPVDPIARARRRRRWWVFGGMAAATALGLAYGPLTRGARAPAAPDLRRIAVLDFDDPSPGRRLSHIALGLTSSLIQELSGASAIQVVSRNTLRALAQRGVPIDSIVATLGVGSLVEGSVQQSGDQVRVSVQLVDARSHTLLQTAQVHRAMGELFLLEDDLAHEVASLLRRRIGQSIRVREASAGTRNAAARELVFRADQAREEASAALATADTAMITLASAKLRAADSMLARAEEADGSWPRPVVDRGQVALTRALHQSGSSRLDAFASGLAHAERALKRWPNDAAALDVRGAIRYREAERLSLADTALRRRLTLAESDLLRALSIDSSRATAWGTLALVRVAKGETADANRAARSALALDTFLTDAPAILWALYAANLMNGSLGDAWQWCRRGASDYVANSRFVGCQLTLLAEDLSLAPDAALAWKLVDQARAMDPKARAAAVGREYAPIYHEVMAAAVSARAGDRRTARSVIQNAERAVAANRGLRLDLLYDEAYVLLLLGEKRAATRLLAEYVAARPTLRQLVARHPRWKPLLSDTAFVRLITIR